MEHRTGEIGRVDDIGVKLAFKNMAKYSEEFAFIDLRA